MMSFQSIKRVILRLLKANMRKLSYLLNCRPIYLGRPPPSCPLQTWWSNSNLPKRLQVRVKAKSGVISCLTSSHTSINTSCSHQSFAMSPKASISSFNRNSKQRTRSTVNGIKKCSHTSKQSLDLKRASLNSNTSFNNSSSSRSLSSNKKEQWRELAISNRLSSTITNTKTWSLSCKTQLPWSSLLTQGNSHLKKKEGILFWLSTRTWFRPDLSSKENLRSWINSSLEFKNNLGTSSLK